MRPRLTYANVASTLIVALLLAGGTAFAANQLARKSVGTKQLKANAVTTAKIKKNAVTKVKIKNGAVDGTKILDGSVTGTDINAASTSFSQVVARIRNTASAPLLENTFVPIGSYTQGAGEDALYLGSLDVTFAAGCESPREVEAFLLEDPSTPPQESDAIGVAEVFDEGTGTVTKRAEFSSFAIVGTGSLQDLARPAATPHTFQLYIGGVNCKTGSGVTFVGAGIDAVGTK